MNAAPVTGGTFLAGYLAAVMFTETGDIDQPPADAEFSGEAVAEAFEECQAFEAAAFADLAEAVAAPGYSPYRAGVDFWLTRNGHGAGFWDRDELPRGPRGRLTGRARDAGGRDLYQGDNGLLYFA